MPASSTKILVPRGISTVTANAVLASLVLFAVMTTPTPAVGWSWPSSSSSSSSSPSGMLRGTIYEKIMTAGTDGTHRRLGGNGNNGNNYNNYYNNKNNNNNNNNNNNGGNNGAAAAADDDQANANAAAAAYDDDVTAAAAAASAVYYDDDVYIAQNSDCCQCYYTDDGARVCDCSACEQGDEIDWKLVTYIALGAWAGLMLLCCVIFACQRSRNNGDGSRKESLLDDGPSRTKRSNSSNSGSGRKPRWFWKRVERNNAARGRQRSRSPGRGRSRSPAGGGRRSSSRASSRTRRSSRSPFSSRS